MNNLRTIKKQGGFTLIELMIVIAIIAILAAIAIPAYQDYVTRTQVSEAANLISSAKLGVAQYRDETSRWAGNNASAGLDKADSINGEYVEKVAISSGKITATIRSAAPANSPIQGKTLVFSPIDEGGAIKWTCDTGDIDDQYLPANCR